MPYGLYMSAEGARAQTQRMEVLSNNLANVNTVGFKPDSASFQARFAEAIMQGQSQPGTGSINDIGGGIETAGVLTDFSPGNYKHTGTPTDLAIEGDGFFQVEQDGETYLTRAGNFRIDSKGQLLTQSGLPVLSEGGSGVFVNPDLGQWNFSPDGALEQAGTKTYLAMVQPKELGDLVKKGENLFSSISETSPLPLGERSVLTEHVEMSGVNPTLSMMELIETSRAIEANMKLIQNQDHMMGALIGRVLQS